ncbi:16S rRNA (uracil1498-N3)-methyltransferase [Desulfobotulus alkaliphilus]|uniref:Ribosomal RNA small subunit methyltransferase E n=1 Tax=Desulfobotulus alkaliphilus TaxID=622671 RepID=A0A562RS46_9BACT|nr:RsmE family RNA methyltransferase [Desulfobotulus alkaliphilus]TWI71753.1 16S rRNA (uracil1498-N3)-methyltransferase [Desulfobotulus alkaliphilus]
MVRNIFQKNRFRRISQILLDGSPEKGEGEVPLAAEGKEALLLWDARPGEVLTVKAQDGRLFRARLLGTRENIVSAHCFEDLGPAPEEPFLHLCQALPEKERFELVLEKATELGVDAIHPFVSRRSATLEMRDAGQKKSHRWPHLLRKASRQCRRPDIPMLFPVKDFSSILDLAASAGLCLVLDEREKQFSFSRALSLYQSGDIVLVVGPEGGLDRDEVAALRAASAQAVTLGTRILRTETAAIVAAALIQHCLP